MLFVHIFGFFAIMIPLWVLAPKTPHEEVWTRFQQTSNWPSMGVAALVGLVGPTLTLVGPDSAVHMGRCKIMPLTEMPNTDSLDSRGD